MALRRYMRENAVDYAHYWAYLRNPDFFNFTGFGGDCTNFVSQCLLAGGAVMNYTPTFGWYYISADDRAPAWSGVEYLYNFLTGDFDIGPYGREVNLSNIEVGDIVQMIFANEEESPVFEHTAIVVSTGLTPTTENTLVAAHSNDCDCRRLNTYNIKTLRCIHIDGIRTE